MFGVFTITINYCSRNFQPVLLLNEKYKIAPETFCTQSKTAWKLHIVSKKHSNQNITWICDDYNISVQSSCLENYPFIMSCTYWLSGRAGRQIQRKIDPREVLWARETEQSAGQENIWHKVMAHGTSTERSVQPWPRANFYPALLNLTQSINT